MAVAQERVVRVFDRAAGEASQQIEVSQYLSQAERAQSQRSVGLFGRRQDRFHRASMAASGIAEEQQQVAAVLHGRAHRNGIFRVSHDRHVTRV